MYQGVLLLKELNIPTIYIWIIFGVLMLLSWIINQHFRIKFRRFTQIPVSGELSGKEIAEKMLYENGIYDVKVVTSKRTTIDHYNHLKKTVNLRTEVYKGRNIASAAIAAHETSHAIQHYMGYIPLYVKTTFIPIITILSKIVLWVLIIGIIFINKYPQILLSGIFIYLSANFLSIITIPVELDASNRALLWLRGSGVTNAVTIFKAKDALKWKAFSYLIISSGSLAIIIYYIKKYLGRHN